MGFRFQRRITVLPGVRLNVGKTGTSVSIGQRGASMTMGKRGTDANVGLPGTGLSYRTRLDTRRSGGHPPYRSRGILAPFIDFMRRLMVRDCTPTEPSGLPEPSGPERIQPSQGRRPEPEVAMQAVDYTARESLNEYEAMIESEGFAPDQEHAFRLLTLLRARERGDPLWKTWVEAAFTDGVNSDDPDEFEEYARRAALARFARRMVEGDRAAWSEVLQTELSNEEVPFGFAFDFSVEEGTDRVHIAIELPEQTIIPDHIDGQVMGKLKVRDIHDDVCCGLALRVVHEIFRVIPEADDIVVSGYRNSPDPRTGAPARMILLKFATDRESFSELNLDTVDPSDAYHHLGGVSRKKRGALQPLGYDPIPQIDD
jgi:hypothetical protein